MDTEMNLSRDTANRYAPHVPNPASRQRITNTPMALVASASLTPLANRFARAAIGCGSQPTENCGTACFRPWSGMREILRAGGDDRALRQLIRDCVWEKKPAHGIDTPDFQRPDRAMYQIGG